MKLKHIRSYIAFLIAAVLLFSFAPSAFYAAAEFADSWLPNDIYDDWSGEIWLPDSIYADWSSAVTSQAYKNKYLESEAVTLEGDTTRVYDGSPQAFTLTCEDAATTSGTKTEYIVYRGSGTTDYEASTAAPTNAGTYTVRAIVLVSYTDADDGNKPKVNAYTKAGSLEITPAPLTITGATVSDKTYDGTTEAEVTELTFDGLFNGETLTFGTDYAIESAIFNSSDVDDAAAVSIKAVLEDTDTARNYALTEDTFEKSASITPTDVTALPGALNVQEGTEKSYEFDLTAMLPAGVYPEQVNEYAVGAVTYSDGILDGDPTVDGSVLTVYVSEDAEAGQTAAIPITFTSANYNITGADVIVTVTGKTVVTLTSSAIDNKVYDGYAVSYAASFDDEAVPAADVVYTWSDGSGALGTAPKDAGNYTLTIALLSDSDYILSQTTVLHFSITKAPLTLTADDVSITAGNTPPSTFPFTVSGLFGNDTWESVKASDPTAQPSDDNYTTAGTYTITIAGGTLNSTAGANYEITSRVNGTLTVKPKQSLILDTPISSGGSSDTPNTAEVGSVSVSYTQSGGVVTLELPDSKVTEIISKSSDTASIDLSKVTNASSASLPSSALTKFADSELDVEILLPQGSITLEAEAAASIAEQVDGGSVAVALKPAPVSSLNAKQQEAIGDAPVYDISVSGGGKQITEFDGASVTIALPYTLKEGENPEYVVALYVDDDGNTEKLPTTYDTSSKKVSFKTTHLSLYAIGYDEALTATPWVNPYFDVSASDWFYGDVEYAYVNGLMTGAAATEFAPNAPMTRAMLVTALFRYASSSVGDDVHIERPSSIPAFTDVLANQWYSDAIAWAAESGIVSGAGDGKFNPDAEVSRQDAAVILARYAEFTGKTPPAIRQPEEFADAEEIADYARIAVEMLNAAGLINGIGGGDVNPLGETTRAEAAALLRRYIEAVNP